jgi:hypothetical protein
MFPEEAQTQQPNSFLRTQNFQRCAHWFLPIRHSERRLIGTLIPQLGILFVIVGKKSRCCRQSPVVVGMVGNSLLHIRRLLLPKE